MTDDDRRLYHALRRWMNDTSCHYDTPEIALRDGLELLNDWGCQWIEDSKERP